MSKVCLVVPCHNEEQRLAGDVMLAFLQQRPSISLCFVDDASADGTPASLRALAARAPGRIQVLTLAQNRGKAEAVRHGVLHALAETDAEIVGYWDADLATPLEELPRLVAACERSAGHLAATGLRLKRLGAHVNRKYSRHVLGRLFATCASVTLRLPVYDSQCGAKVFRRDAARIAFADAFLSKWLFDVEILARLRNHYGGPAILEHVLEVPLEQWTHIEGSKLRPRHYLAAPLDLWRIARRYNRG